MAAPTRSLSAGSNYAFICWYDSNNQFLVGGTRTAPSAGDQSGNPAARIQGIKSASPTINTPDTVQVTGDDALLAEFEFSSIDTRQFEVTVAVQDLTVAGYMSDVSTFNAASGDFIVMDTDAIDNRNAVIILQANAKNEQTGGSAWSGVFAVLCTTKFLGRSTFEERAAGDYRFSVTPQRSVYLPWGVTMTSGNQGSSDGRYMAFSADLPFHLHVFTGNGSETQFTLKHDVASLSQVAAWVDRVPVTIDTLSTNTITLASAPGNGRPIIVLYQFDGYNE